MAKKKINVLIVIGILSSILFGCGSKESKINLVDINNKNVESVNNFNLSEIADSVFYIKLETNKNCLIGDISDIQYIDNKVFILNSVQGVKEALVFDKSGHFLNRIGTRGNGPGEYTSLASMGVNPFEKNVILLDPLKKSIHLYDYSGKYLKSIPAKKECGYVYKVRLVSNNRMRCVSLVNNVNSTILSECDLDFDNEQVLSKTNFTFNGGYRFALNPISANGNLFTTPLSDIIYQYNNDSLVPAFRLNLDSKYQPIAEMEEGGDFGKLYIDAIKKGFAPLNSISESKDLLLIQPFTGSPVLWNKINNKGLKLENSTSSATSNCLPIYSSSIISGFNNGFAVMYTSSDLSGIAELYQESKIEPDQGIKDFLSDLAIESNPSICIYKF